MKKAVFTASDTSNYDDIKDKQYHFPNTYLNKVEEAVGSQVLFYQPRRNSGPATADGAKAYFAAARVVGIRKDPRLPSHHFADLTDYVEFDSKVPFRVSGRCLESALQKDDGTNNQGSFGRSVRLIPDEEFNQIWALGFAKSITEAQDGGEERYDLDSPAPVLTERPTTISLVERRIRDIAFRRNVLDAYDGTCAVTGLRIVDHLGRFEAQAAHVMAVAEHGSDWVRNGVAMTATAHWLFDRGLISIAEDHSLLVSPSVAPVSSSISMRQELLLPTDPSKRPHPEYLKWHRDRVYKG